MSIISAGATDIGRKRKTNQDAIAILPEANFFCVADGMGGHKGGDIASQMCVEHFPKALQEFAYLEPKERLMRSVQYVNFQIFQKSEMNPELKGMGTTVAAILFQGSQLFISNVGDSRVYMLHEGHLYQLTRDHSFVQEKLNHGLYNREEAARDKQKNVLVRSVGFEPEVHADVFVYKVSKGDLFLICSDGLHGKVSDEDIHHLLVTNTAQGITQETLQKTIHDLINLANENGGQDNISVILSNAQ